MTKTVDYYLAKGFDLKAAEYFANGRKKIIAVTPNNNFTLSIRFDNGETRIYDVRPLLKKGTIFEHISNIDKFCRVYIDEEHCIAWDIDPAIDSSKVWGNKIDLCPDTCYIDSQPIGDTQDV